ncbi:MAG: hypothetical protein WB816_08570 [Methylocystis sp.]
MTWETISPAAAALAPLRVGQAYGAKLMELGAVNVNSTLENVNSTLEFVGELSSAKTPADFAEAVGNETRRRLQTLTEQFEEMSRLFGASKVEETETEVTGFGD